MHLTVVEAVIRVEPAACRHFDVRKGFRVDAFVNGNDAVSPKQVGRERVNFVRLQGAGMFCGMLLRT